MERPYGIQLTALLKINKNKSSNSQPIFYAYTTKFIDKLWKTHVNFNIGMTPSQGHFRNVT